jgi:hypothetical protein
MSDYMNYILKYYYDIEKEDVYYKNGTIYIRNNSDCYIMKEINDSYYVDNISKLLEESNVKSEFSEIVKAKNNKNYVETGRKKYVLIKITNKYKPKEWLKKLPISVELSKYKYINRSNWYFLWSTKNDFEQIVNKKRKKESTIDELHEYFIGIAENAILYYSLSSSNKNNGLCIAQKRIDEKDKNNPLNLVIDRRERDIAEMIKYVYFNNENYETKLNLLMEISIKEKLSFEMIFSRVLYPTKYFDIIEKNNKEYQENNTLSKLLKYENFLIEVQNKIKSINKTIKKIDWL